MHNHQRIFISSNILGCSEEPFFMKYSRPRPGSEHGRHIPSGAKDVEGLWKTVIVYEASVDGEQAHHQDDVTPLKERVPDLQIYIKSLT